VVARRGRKRGLERVWPARPTNHPFWKTVGTACLRACDELGEPMLDAVLS